MAVQSNRRSDFKLVFTRAFSWPILMEKHLLKRHEFWELHAREMSTIKSSQEKIRFNAKNVRYTIERLKVLADIKFGPAAKRSDFYDYLEEVYRWVSAWKVKRRTNRLRARIAEAMGYDDPRSNADEFHLAIAATCPKSKKTISKFAIALLNASLVEIPPRRFKAFLRAIGGPTAICTRDSVAGLNRRIRDARERRSVDV